MAHTTTSNLGMQDYFTTTLNGNVAAGDTVINLNAVPTASEGYLVIDPNNTSTREVIYYNSKTSSSVTCPDASAGSSRGLGGTSVQAHTSGTLVEMREVAEYWNALQNGQSIGIGAVGATLIAVNGVQGQNIGTTAIMLGYTQQTGNYQQTGITNAAPIPSLTAAVTIPAGNRHTEIEVYIPWISVGGANIVSGSIWNGTPAVGTQVGFTEVKLSDAADVKPMLIKAIVTPAAGAQTYSAAWSTSATSAQVNASITGPAYIAVKAF